MLALGGKVFFACLLDLRVLYWGVGVGWGSVFFIIKPPPKAAGSEERMECTAYAELALFHASI